MTSHAAQHLQSLGGLDHSRMQKLLGYNLAQAAIPAFGIYEKAIGSPLKLRQVDFTILTLIDSNTDVTQKRLSHALGIAPSNLTVILDRNVKLGLIERVRSDNDRRSQLLQLTASGKTLVRKAARISETMEAELLGHFSEGERVILFELLQRVAHLRRVLKSVTKEAADAESAR